MTIPTDEDLLTFYKQQARSLRAEITKLEAQKKNLADKLVHAEALLSDATDAFNEERKPHLVLWIVLLVSLFFSIPHIACIAEGAFTK